MQDKLEAEIIVKTSIWIMLLNGFLAVIKIIAGVLGNSTAMISDAVNSISDVLTNLVVMISGKFSRKGIDDSHPYGHEKFDSMVSVLLGVAIIITAFEIGKAAVIIIYNYAVYGDEITPPKLIALIVAISTIVIKEGMYRFTKINAKKSRSSSLNAQALDHRSDELASFGAVIGIGGSMLGVAFLEPVASIVICFFVLRVGFQIIKVGFSQVVDQSADEEIILQIKKIVLDNPQVKGLDDLKTRMFGMKLYVDLEISVDQSLSILEAHKIADMIHDQIEELVPDVKHCMIHVNPHEE
ncbi:MAG: cation diffusion facilitator family transporter [Firmicutes bacterium]|nr:cation diffusion facilitator family transporter [Bacillota bacterium]